jgi:hypothetical protein
VRQGGDQYQIAPKQGHQAIRRPGLEPGLSDHLFDYSHTICLAEVFIHIELSLQNKLLYALKVRDHSNFFFAGYDSFSKRLLPYHFDSSTTFADPSARAEATRRRRIWMNLLTKAIVLFQPRISPTFLS